VRVRGGGHSAPRKVDLERRTRAELAVRADVPLALSHDAVDAGEAQAGSPRLGREEGVEDPAERALVHADAGVGHLEEDIRAGDDAEGFGSLGLVELDVRCADGERAPASDRVARVHRQVEHDLRELASIGENRTELGIELADELDVFADQPIQECERLLDDPVQVDHLRT
jgi:hypothetical protein